MPERRYGSAWNVESIELRVDDSGVVAGHAAVFNTLSNELFGFRERIAPGAFKSSIRSDDVKALWNHDPSLVLGRNKSGTLKLSEDRTGLAFELTLPDSPAGQNAREAISRGDVSEMSFAFRAIKESWERQDSDEDESKKPPIRTLEEVRLFDVSPVAFPAYPGTDVGARSLYDDAIASLARFTETMTQDTNRRERHQLREAEALGWFKGE